MVRFEVEVGVAAIVEVVEAPVVREIRVVVVLKTVPVQVAERVVVAVEVAFEVVVVIVVVVVAKIA